LRLQSCRGERLDPRLDIGRVPVLSPLIQVVGEQHRALGVALGRVQQRSERLAGISLAFLKPAHHVLRQRITWQRP
jgi:hypothetical protein